MALIRSMLNLKQVTRAHTGDEEVTEAGGAFHLSQDWSCGSHCRQRERKKPMKRPVADNTEVMLLLDCYRRCMSSFMNNAESRKQIRVTLWLDPYWIRQICQTSLCFIFLKAVKEITSSQWNPQSWSE